MKIAIISAKTGNGHNMVMHSLEQCLKQFGYEVSIFPTFYEDLMPSNKIMSDFYNFLTINSIELCCKLSELSYITRPDLTEDFYKGVKDSIIEFLEENKFDIIISTIHTVNHAFLRILEEKKLKKQILYFIVVTDPYNPISIGFDCKGADYYFVHTQIVKNYLLKKGVLENKIDVVGYPINEKFKKFIPDVSIFKKFEIDQYKKTVFINSGSQGSYLYFDILKKIIDSNFKCQIIFVCGKNKILFKQVSQYIQKNNLESFIKVYGFIDFIPEVLYVSDFVISKAGANTIFECLYTQTPIIVDATHGLLFQEQGIKEFLELYDVGAIANNIDEMILIFKNFMNNEILEEKKANISQLKISDGKEEIINKILSIYNNRRKYEHSI